MANLDKKVGPIPMWGWGIVLGVGFVFWTHTTKKKPLNDSIDTAYETVATLPPPNVSGFSMDPYDAYDYASGSVMPVAVPNVSPTPGSQGATWQPGLTPAVAPIGSTFGGIITDPTTGRPVYSGPNGEGGTAWSPGSPVPTGYMTYQMPDGRWSSYMPNTYVQNGNRVALGLTPVDWADSTAPGANPVSVQQLLGMAS